MKTTLLLLPVISAFIGWFTNWVAIKMLFHPQKPVKFLGITVQGVFPKNQAKFAQNLGRMVSNELLSFADIEAKITNPANLQKVMPLVETHIDDFLRKKLAESMPVISMFIGDKTIEQLKMVFMAELQTLFPQLLGNYMQQLQTDLDLEKIVTEKVAAFSTQKLEALLVQIIAKEFRFIEILGGILGFIIGVFQILLTLIA
ncbi:MAG: DUF445 family protein [Bacteroidetes bacterium]|nr:MAG: DUF445 family protein [Bacteroidota bacterium]TAF95776.1 MAG: DUF445 family protein [Bacteroidota bacterium]